MEKIINCVECEELRVKGKTHQDMWCNKEDKKIVQRSKNHVYQNILTPKWCSKNDEKDNDNDNDCYDDDYEECDECGDNYWDCDCE